MVVISYFDYHHLHKLTIPILLVTYAFCSGSVYARRNGVRRWIYLGPVNFSAFFRDHKICFNFDLCTSDLD